MFICEIIIIILIGQKLGLVGPVQQKIKLPSPKHKVLDFFSVLILAGIPLLSIFFFFGRWRVTAEG